MAELIDPRDLTALKALVTSYRMEAAAVLSLLARKGWLSKSGGEELMQELQHHPHPRERKTRRNRGRSPGGRRLGLGRHGGSAQRLYIQRR